MSDDSTVLLGKKARSKFQQNYINEEGFIRHYNYQKKVSLIFPGTECLSVALRREVDLPGPGTHRTQDTLHPCFWRWRTPDWIKGQALPRQSLDQTLWELLFCLLLPIWSQVPGCEEWNSFPSWWVRRLARGIEVELCLAKVQTMGKMAKTTYISLAVSCWGNKVN